MLHSLHGLESKKAKTLTDKVIVILLESLNQPGNTSNQDRVWAIFKYLHISVLWDITMKK